MPSIRRGLPQPNAAPEGQPYPGPPAPQSYQNNGGLGGGWGSLAAANQQPQGFAALNDQRRAQEAYTSHLQNTRPGYWNRVDVSDWLAHWAGVADVPRAGGRATFQVADEASPIRYEITPEELNKMSTMTKPNIGRLLRKFVAAMRAATSDERRVSFNRDLLALMRDNIDNFYLRAKAEPQMQERAAFYGRMAAWLRDQGIHEEVHQCQWCHTIVFVSQRNHIPLWDTYVLREPGEEAEFVCSGCAHYMRDTRAYYIENRTVIPAGAQIEGSILSYNTDATTMTVPLVARGERDPMMLGVELECVVRAEHVDHNWGANRVAQQFRETAPWLITKSDGSIAGSGFEIVTAPMSLKVHQFLWSGMFETDLMAKVRGDTSCGLHVHLSKKHMSALTLGKMAYFLNYRANQALVEAVAGRRSTSYARFDEASVARVGLAALHRSEKYRVFNTGKTATAELRIGASTTNKVELLGRIEFAHAVWAFCKQASSARNQISAAHFCRFVKDEATTYPFLVRLLTQLFSGEAASSRLIVLKEQLLSAGVHFQPKLPPLVVLAPGLPLAA